ncbi:MAG TPA: hypothetical protein DCF33_08735 [Saprospirales bacterium]|nr:hypothetical protein [Saprospirales bacterium]
MKNVFIILFIFSTLSAFGQDNSKFKLGGMIVPSYSGNFILKDENVPPGVANTFKGIEAVTLGYSAYLFIRYKAFAKFDINVGLGYSRTNLNTIKNKLIF